MERPLPITPCVFFETSINITVLKNFINSLKEEIKEFIKITVKEFKGFIEEPKSQVPTNHKKDRKKFTSRSSVHLDDFLLHW